MSLFRSVALLNEPHIYILHNVHKISDIMFSCITFRQLNYSLLLTDFIGSHLSRFVHNVFILYPTCQLKSLQISLLAILGSSILNKSPSSVCHSITCALWGVASKTRVIDCLTSQRVQPKPIMWSVTDRYTIMTKVHSQECSGTNGQTNCVHQSFELVSLLDSRVTSDTSNQSSKRTNTHTYLI